MERFALKTDPMANDPGRWGHSLGNLAEIWGPVLDAARPRSVLEVGAYAGDVTRILLDWAAPTGARVTAIDPDPQPPLEQLAADEARLELIRARSLDAIPALPAHDAVIIDGDHNYYTVSEELRLIAAWAPEGGLPLILCHDACWPHGRRDAYYDIERIPEQERQPTVELGHLFPGDDGIHAGGLLLYHHRVAQREGGPRNGVRTAIEDFAAGRPDVALAVVPAFFGLAALWPADAAWSEEVSALLQPWACNPMLARLEANRVLHLASRELEHAQAESQRARAQSLEERWAHGSALLSRLLQSRAFSAAVLLSRLRRGGVPEFSKEEIRQLLGR